MPSSRTQRSSYRFGRKGAEERFFWESATGSHVEVLKGETTFSSGGVREFTCSKRFRMGAGIFGVPRPNLRTGSVKEQWG